MLGSILNIVALGYGNAILVSGSRTMAIVNNQILSIAILKEKLHKNDVIAAFLIIVGSVLFIS